MPESTLPLQAASSTNARFSYCSFLLPSSLRPEGGTGRCRPSIHLHLQLGRRLGGIVTTDHQPVIPCLGFRQIQTRGNDQRPRDQQIHWAFYPLIDLPHDALPLLITRRPCIIRCLHKGTLADGMRGICRHLLAMMLCMRCCQRCWWCALLDESLLPIAPPPTSTACTRHPRKKRGSCLLIKRSLRISGRPHRMSCTRTSSS